MDLFSSSSSPSPKFKEQHALLIHIGSEAVVSSHVVFLGGTLPSSVPTSNTHSLLRAPRLISTHRESVPIQSRQNVERLIDSTVEALGSTLVSLEKELHSSPSATHALFSGHRFFGGRSISKIYCFFSSPWHLSQTKIIRAYYEKPIAVTEHLIAEIAEREKKTVITEANFKEKVEAVETKVLSVKLNGYETAQPYGKSASEIEISLYVSIVGKDFLDSVKETISRIFTRAAGHDGNAVGFHTFPVAAFSVIRDIAVGGKNPVHNFLIIDVAGEVTDVSIVKKGVILQSFSLPLGKNHFIRAISDEMHLPHEVALSLMALYAQDKSDPATTERLKKILQESSVEWQAAFHKALADLSEESFVPPNVFLSADEELSPFFSKTVGAQDFSQFSTQKTTFDICIVNENYLRDAYNFAYDMNPSFNRNTPALLESLFLTKIRV